MIEIRDVLPAWMAGSGLRLVAAEAGKGPQDWPPLCDRCGGGGVGP